MGEQRINPAVGDVEFARDRRKLADRGIELAQRQYGRTLEQQVAQIILRCAMPSGTRGASCGGPSPPSSTSVTRAHEIASDYV